MHPVVEARREDVRELCVRYRVQTLELFGSATGDRFDPETSDLDFLVRFQPMTPGEHWDCYFGLLFSLEKLFGRSVDLVEVAAIDNPYFLLAIQPERVPLYAA